jgi:3'-phosphoadenosine 5'-phosphosulfate sulfotransferase (PAPS reductase)/FAD synthetase
MDDTNFDILYYQKLSLDEKILLSLKYIKEYSIKHDNKIYVSFSGGLDSTVLLHLVRTNFPNIKAVFSDTGLEYPEIRQFVKTFDNVDIVKPKLRFDQVINKYGYPVISKRVSRYVEDLQNPTEKNENVRKLRLTGISNCTHPGKYQPSMKLSKKWLYLVNAPFKISNKCCDKLKKQPLNDYSKTNDMHRIIGVMADESNMRLQQARRIGVGNEFLQPMIFWTRQDVLKYIQLMSLDYCKVYGDIVTLPDGSLDTTGEHRTGCMFCMFGVNLEKGENRFQRMKRTHPIQYDYCINTLGCSKVLDFIGVKYG